MRSLLLGVALAIATPCSPAAAQTWSVITAAIGADESSTAHGRRLLEAVARELEPSPVTVRERMDDLRHEMPANAVFSRAFNLEASGAVVIEFHATGSPTAGYAHLWVSGLNGRPGQRIEHVADVTTDLTGVARTFAAIIVDTITRGAYAFVEFHVFTWPPGVSVQVGDADPVISRPGREPGEGFALWSGVRPAGSTAIRLSKRPDYEDRTIRVDLPAGGPERFRILVEASLTRADRQER